MQTFAVPGTLGFLNRDDPMPVPTQHSERLDDTCACIMLEELGMCFLHMFFLAWSPFLTSLLG